jgi:hypothetical protein
VTKKGAKIDIPNPGTGPTRSRFSLTLRSVVDGSTAVPPQLKHMIAWLDLRLWGRIGNDLRLAGPQRG